MLQQMQTRFGEMNTSIVTRIDDMGKKIDELETSIGELIQEAQNENEEAPKKKE
jgi:heat shock factor-binding protein 1